MKARLLQLGWVVAAVVVIATVVWKLYPLEDASARVSMPVAPTGGSVEELPLNEWERKFFAEAKVGRWLLRGGGPPIIATVVDGTRNRRAVHDPGFCFRGAGWTVVDERVFVLPHGEGSLVRLSRAAETAEAIYWYSDGLSAHADPRRYWMEATVRRLSLGRSGPEPVLVMLVPAGPSPAGWQEWLRKWPMLVRY